MPVFYIVSRSSGEIIGDVDVPSERHAQMHINVHTDQPADYWPEATPDPEALERYSRE